MVVLCGQCKLKILPVIWECVCALLFTCTYLGCIVGLHVVVVVALGAFGLALRLTRLGVFKGYIVKHFAVLFICA